MASPSFPGSKSVLYELEDDNITSDASPISQIPGLTGIRDLDVKILMDVPDEDLYNLCRTNEYFSEICRDDAFWRERFLIKYPMFKNYFILFPSTPARDIYKIISIRNRLADPPNPSNNSLLWKDFSEELYMTVINQRMINGLMIRVNQLTLLEHCVGLGHPQLINIIFKNIDLYTLEDMVIFKEYRETDNDRIYQFMSNIRFQEQRFANAIFSRLILIENAGILRAFAIMGYGASNWFTKNTDLYKDYQPLPLTYVSYMIAESLTHIEPSENYLLPVGSDKNPNRVVSYLDYLYKNNDIFQYPISFEIIMFSLMRNDLFTAEVKQWFIDHEINLSREDIIFMVERHHGGDRYPDSLIKHLRSYDPRFDIEYSRR